MILIPTCCSFLLRWFGGVCVCVLQDNVNPQLLLLELKSYNRSQVLLCNSCVCCAQASPKQDTLRQDQEGRKKEKKTVQFLYPMILIDFLFSTMTASQEKNIQFLKRHFVPGSKILCGSPVVCLYISFSFSQVGGGLDIHLLVGLMPMRGKRNSWKVPERLSPNISLYRHGHQRGKGSQGFQSLVMEEGQEPNSPSVPLGRAEVGSDRCVSDHLCLPLEVF